MPELNSGFIPFSNVEKGYYDEVGNDYNPHGWNTATAMTYTSGTVTADGKTINVIKPTVDETVNHDGFIKGIWNKINTGDGSGEGSAAPIVKPISISTPDVIDKDHTTIKDFKATVEVEPGVDPITNIKFEGIINDVVVITQVVSDPQPGTLEFTISDDIMKQILESGATEITYKVTVSDGTRESSSEKVLQIVHQVLFGVTYSKDNSIVPGIIENLTDNEKIQKRTIGYEEKTFNLSPFYPTEEWAYMFIAIPADFGNITRIVDGAVYEIGPDEWKPSTCKIKGIDYKLYVMQYNNEGTFEFIVTVG